MAHANLLTLEQQKKRKCHCSSLKPSDYVGSACPAVKLLKVWLIKLQFHYTVETNMRDHPDKRPVG